nr:putative ribonuclease H-like domain-containing protein [Ipomoea batatas]
MVETDANNIVEALNMPNSGSNYRGLLANIIQDCKQWLMKPWDITVTHIFREQNRVADVLAKRALSYDRGLLIFHQPVPEVVLSLEEDVLGFPQGSGRIRICAKELPESSFLSSFSMESRSEKLGEISGSDLVFKACRIKDSHFGCWATVFCPSTFPAFSGTISGTWFYNTKRLEILGIKMVETDANNIVEALNMPNSGSNYRGLLANIIQDCQQWLMKPWDITVTHIFREQNRVADVLAKRALSYDRGLLIFISLC